MGSLVRCHHLACLKTHVKVLLLFHYLCGRSSMIQYLGFVSEIVNNLDLFQYLGNYSCLVAKFHLSRSIGFHMVQSYIPTILIVVISWVSFWMDTDSVPGRTTLGVTTLLTVSSKSAGNDIRRLVVTFCLPWFVMQLLSLLGTEQGNLANRNERTLIIKIAAEKNPIKTSLWTYVCSMYKCSFF